MHWFALHRLGAFQRVIKMNVTKIKSFTADFLESTNKSNPALCGCFRKSVGILRRPWEGMLIYLLTTCSLRSRATLITKFKWKLRRDGTINSGRMFTFRTMIVANNYDIRLNDNRWQARPNGGGGSSDRTGRPDRRRRRRHVTKHLHNVALSVVREL